MQWLDDLDDLLYAGALTSERTRRGTLVVGLLASSLSAFASPAPAASWLPAALVGVALASVGVWSAGAAAAALAEPAFDRSHA